MRHIKWRIGGILSAMALGIAATVSGATGAVSDPLQVQERSVFQAAAPYADDIHLCSDVAIVYGIDAGMPERVKTWRERGYRVHVMTGVSWGEYQDYLYGRFDGVNHEDEAQTDRAGNKISHGGDVYYMSPGENYGKFLCVGVKRALDAGVEAIHLEEPEFWVRAGYSEGFKAEWKSYYGQDWEAPHGSVEAQWKASKLKYYLYQRALQQVFDFIQEYNREQGKQVKCYVPTHSLLNYAHWGIVSPESSLARLKGCDGYIAQVWTGTSRTPNFYNGSLKERTFETAFLEYSSMYNLVRSTGRIVWYLNDPVEDNPAHDWNDYRVNWESTLTASLLQPEVWRYEVMPWPSRVFRGKYPSNVPEAERKGIPAEYATELQVVMRALNDMNQIDWAWDHNSSRVGQLVSDSLMFQRGELGSDPNMGHVYGMALPLLKRGIPVEMVQLENVGIEDYLKDYALLLLSYTGMKPLSPEVHAPIAEWVKKGGILVIADDDADPFHAVKEWWNSGDKKYATPRQHLMETLGVKEKTPKKGAEGQTYRVGKGRVSVEKRSPVSITAEANGDELFMERLRSVCGKKVKFDERSSLALRRGPYYIAAGLDESVSGQPWGVNGRFVNLFDPKLQLLTSVDFTPGSRYFLLNLDRVQKPGKPSVLAGACRVLDEEFQAEGNSKEHGTLSCKVDGIAGTQAVMLCSIPATPKEILLGDEKLSDFNVDVIAQLLWIRFENRAEQRQLKIIY